MPKQSNFWKTNFSDAYFHDAFAGIPEEEVIRDFEEALAEVRRERAEAAGIHT